MQDYLGVNREQLKIIALVSMLIDHISAIFLEYGSILYDAGRNIGRLSFPIFLVLFIFSFEHVTNHKKHILLLTVSAVVSEYFYFELFKPYHNIMIQWLMMYILFLVIQHFDDKTMTVSACFLFGISCSLLKIDYDIIPAVCIMIYWILKNKLSKLELSFIIISFTALYTMQPWCLFSVPLFCVYNEKDYTRLTPKYLYYIVYPAHLSVFWYLSPLVQGHIALQ